MYDIIYSWVYDNFLNTQALNDFTFEMFNNTINMRVYLSHTITIVFMVLALVLLILFARWLIKLFAGLFKW